MLKYLKYRLLLRKLTKRYEHYTLGIMASMCGELGLITSRVFDKYSAEASCLNRAIIRIKKLRKKWEDEKN